MWTLRVPKNDVSCCSLSMVIRGIGDIDWEVSSIGGKKMMQRLMKKLEHETKLDIAKLSNFSEYPKFVNYFIG